MTPGMLSSGSLQHRQIALRELRNGTAPTLIGHFRLTALIHRGANSTLYRAAAAQEPLGPGCYVIKTLETAVEGSAILLSSLRREALALGSAPGSHLAAFLANQLGNTQPHAVFAYLEGVS